MFAIVIRNKVDNGILLENSTEVRWEGKHIGSWEQWEQYQNGKGAISVQASTCVPLKNNVIWNGRDIMTRSEN